MNTTVISPAGLRVSKIGLGCVTFGREIGEAAAHGVLDHAFAREITLFDTAAAYAQGASESIIGRWMASRRPAAGSVTVATKIQPPYEPARLADAVGDSLRRLGLTAIDLLYLHRWDATAESPASLAALDALVRAGKVRALGASNYNRQQLETALALQQRHGLERFSVAQNNQNLAVNDVSAEFREFCAARKIAIVTYSPLGAGFLTGKHRRGVQPGSRFDLVPGHQEVYFHDTAWRRLAQVFDGGADLHVEGDGVGCFGNFGFSARFRLEEGAPVFRHGRQALLPSLRHGPIVTRTHVRPVTAQALNALAGEDEAERRVDGEVKVRRSHRLGVGVRQRVRGGRTGVVHRE